MKLDNDVPCPNCGRIDGAPAIGEAEEEEATYMPATRTFFFACSHCVETLQASLDKGELEP